MLLTKTCMQRLVALEGDPDIIAQGKLEVDLAMRQIDAAEEV